MTKYSKFMICEGSHPISSFIEDVEKGYEEYGNFCEKCGSKNIIKCEKCNSFIKGTAAGDWHAIKEIPLFCKDCGASYPWFRLFLEEIADVLSGSLDEKDIDDFCNNVKKIVTNAPGKKICESKIKEIALKINDSQIMKSVQTICTLHTFANGLFFIATL